MSARTAFTAVLAEKGGYIIGLATEHVPGYVAKNLRWFDTYKQAQDLADGLNTDMGLDKKEAAKIVLSTMGHGAPCL